ncbi:MAG: S24/S26 family peptidase [Candidatus Doudnabacteria bacterium]
MFGLKIFRINGHSMEPALKAGSFVLARTKINKILLGDIIVFGYKEDKVMIKRIVKIENDLIFVEGDNKSDSLQIPPIKKSQITGKVIWL